MALMLLEVLSDDIVDQAAVATIVTNLNQKRIDYISLSENMLSFSKWVSEQNFHFQNVKGFVSVIFPFSRRTQKFVNKNLHSHYKYFY